ncbi:hypothetical protein KRR40_34845 [Niabella defluvii]|nr:hypothetical protein KRR40_34845 [Niabella sp. I65]
MITAIETKFSIAAPEKSVADLVALYKLLSASGNHYWIEKKEVRSAATGCFM